VTRTPACKPVGASFARIARHLAGPTLLLLALGFAAPSRAQTTSSGSSANGPLPEMVAPDAMGIDLLSGQRVGTDSAITIGAVDSPALSLTEGGGGLGGTPLGGFHYTDGAYPHFSDFFVLGNRGVSNTYGDGTARNFPDGIIGGSGGATEGDGTRWNMTGGGSGSPYADAYLTTLVRPDGETLTYTYSGVPNGDIRGKLRSIRSSAGYQLNIEWEAVPGTYRLKKATLVNRRYAYCDTAGTCTGSYSWPTLSWTVDSSNNTVVSTSGLRSVTYGAPQTFYNPSIYEWTQQITSGAGVRMPGARTSNSGGTAGAAIPAPIPARSGRSRKPPAPGTTIGNIAASLSARRREPIRSGRRRAAPAAASPTSWAAPRSIPASTSGEATPFRADR
jgi:hypothetical protein